MSIRETAELVLDTDRLVREAQQVFPLRLTPFEQYMLADNLLGNDMTFTMKFDVEGVIDRSAFHSAVRHTAARHPLCRATLERGQGRQCQWILSPVTWPTVTWNDEATHQQPPPDLFA